MPRHPPHWNWRSSQTDYRQMHNQMHLKRSPNDWRCNPTMSWKKCGIEHAIHSLRETYQQPETEAILLIDASNAFNALNRKLAMRNIDRICPSLTSAVYNSYIYPSELFVNGETLLSEEGTTQGDQIAMTIFRDNDWT